MIDGDYVRRSCKKLPSVEPGVDPRDDLPGMCVGRRFAREEAGVKFGKRAVEVLDIEADPSHGEVVVADLDDAERLSADFRILQPAVRGAHARERETLPASSDGRRQIGRASCR